MKFSKMKPHIVFYATYQMHTGGVERNVLQAIDFLSDRYRFTILASTTEHFQHELARRGASYYAVEKIPSAFSPSAIVRLAKQLKTELGADMIHTLEPRSSTIGALAGKLVGIPVVHWHNVSPLDYSSNRLKKVVYMLGEAFLGWCCIDKSIFVAESTRHRYRHFTPAHKTCYIPVSVDVQSYQTARQNRLQNRLHWQIHEDEFLWVNLGRYHPQKAQDILIEAAANLSTDRKWKLILAGGGELEQALERLIQKFNLENRVFLVGSLPHPQAIALLAAADALVLPSRYENMPNVVLEAMAMNLPSIVTDVGDSWEMSGGGALPPASLCVPKNDAQALAGVMDQLMEDENLYQSFAVAGTARAARYDPQTTMQQLAEVYASLV